MEDVSALMSFSAWFRNSNGLHDDDQIENHGAAMRFVANCWYAEPTTTWCGESNC